MFICSFFYRLGSYEVGSVLIDENFDKLRSLGRNEPVDVNQIKVNDFGAL